ncbi:MAG: DNA polymerase III [Treponema sp.]|nr:DNA polymerase III [Treponema sp.]
MFENIIEQGAVLQLQNDIINSRIAPSMLFYGPAESGKCSAALELARVLSCDNKGEWKCACPHCEQHRYLQNEDLLILGQRSFSAEIQACYSAFKRNPSSAGSKLLFFRSIRKLQIRFSPVLMEDDPKYSKIGSILQSLDEGLNEFSETSCASLIKNAAALENEGFSSTIPIAHIRSASSWCRLAPAGKRKTLIIENADNMRDEARNSLLKLLEEPPSSVSIVLTAKRRETIMPTILSRLRPYRFLKRDAKSEKEVIRRVFQDEGENLNKYLESFMPQSTEKLYPLAAFFIVSLARIVSVSIKKKDPAAVPLIFNVLGEYCAPIAEKSGFDKSLKSAVIIKTILSQSSNFEDGSFPRFSKIVLEMIGSAQRAKHDSGFIAYNDIFNKYINEAVNSIEILNINTAIVIESLFYNLKKALRGQYG